MSDENYEPYGDEWTAEMMRLTKAELIGLLRKEFVNNKSPLGQAIRSRREAVGFSLRQIAGDCEISPSFLCDIELGRRYPSADTLELIECALGVDLSQCDTRP